MTASAAPPGLVAERERPAVTSTVAPTPTRERLVSLDVFRGMTVAGMLLVNNPGTWGAIYPPLRHAPWHGWTPTDLIFPFFLFIVGITTHLSLSARRERGDDERSNVRQILRRGALIFLFGFLLSAFPFVQWGPAPEGVTSWAVWDRFVYRWEHVRILGVLQRIGIAYVLAALLTLRTTPKQQVAILAVLLYGYWFAMTLLPVPGRGLGYHMLGEPSGSIAAWLDRAILGEQHLWVGGRTWDPEGLLSTLPAVGTAMLGVLAGRWIGTRRALHERLAGLFAAGALGMMAGLMWHWSFPINKNIWTSSYVLFTGGMACVVLATCIWLIDAHKVTWWTRPFVIYGVNPMIAFVGSGLMARIIYSIWKVEYDGQQMAAQTAIYKAAFASWLPPQPASLAFALSFVLFWLAILTVLYRKRIFLKV